MERQLILRNVMTAAEWAKIRDKVHYRYEKDHYYSEFKHQETMSQRVDLARNMEDYVGKYYSKEWFRTNILKQPASEVEKQDELIAKETEEGGAVIDFDPSARPLEAGFADNLAEYLEDNTLGKIASDIVDQIKFGEEAETED